MFCCGAPTTSRLRGASGLLACGRTSARAGPRHPASMALVAPGGCVRTTRRILKPTRVVSMLSLAWRIFCRSSLVLLLQMPARGFKAARLCQSVPGRLDQPGCSTKTPQAGPMRRAYWTDSASNDAGLKPRLRIRSRAASKNMSLRLSAYSSVKRLAGPEMTRAPISSCCAP